jgi:hypothetical protein
LMGHPRVLRWAKRVPLRAFRFIEDLGVTSILKWGFFPQPCEKIATQATAEGNIRLSKNGVGLCSNGISRGRCRIAS